MQNLKQFLIYRTRLLSIWLKQPAPIDIRGPYEDKV